MLEPQETLENERRELSCDAVKYSQDALAFVSLDAVHESQQSPLPSRGTDTPCAASRCGVRRQRPRGVWHPTSFFPAPNPLVRPVQVWLAGTLLVIGLVENNLDEGKRRDARRETHYCDRLCDVQGIPTPPFK